VKAFAPGIYPRSEALVQATRDLDRGRISADAAERQLAADRAALVAAQEEAGLDLLADGMLNWQDLFRPLVEGSEGLEAGPLVRFLDTNTFYRAPRGNGSPRFTAAATGDFIATLPGPRLVTLPSPFAFAHAAGLDPRTVAEAVLAPALDALDAELVVLSEPFLARDRAPDLAAFGEALGLLSGRLPIALQLTLGDAGPLLERLAQLPVDGIGIDFYLTSLDAVPDRFPKLLLAGVVDARSSAVEDAGVVAGFAARLRERTAGEIALVPNGDLQFVAEPIARRKLAALGAAKAAAVEAAA
jgi:5-methyltetrahydropteroyltriglutamate--homocysteine methyltransferase